MKIENLSSVYTGGGIWLISGKANGEWFATSNDFASVDIFDADYNEADDGDTEEWYMNHFLYTPDNAKRNLILHSVYQELVNSGADEALLSSMRPEIYPLGGDVYELEDYYLCLDAKEKERNDAQRMADVMRAIREAVDYAFQVNLGEQIEVMKEGYHDRYAYLHLVQTMLGNIYCVQHEDEYGELVDDILTFNRTEAARTYIDTFDALLDD